MRSRTKRKEKEKETKKRKEKKKCVCVNRNNVQFIRTKGGKTMKKNKKKYIGQQGESR